MTYDINAVNSFDLKNVFKTIKNSDVLISGGGSLLQDVTSKKSLIYYLGLIFAATLLKKDVIIFAQGLGPFRSKISQILTKLALKRCKLITVRDTDSQRLLNDWGIDSKLVCDPVFTFDIKSANKQNTIGIQLRSFIGVNDDFLKRLAEAVNATFYDKDVVILISDEKEKPFANLERLIKGYDKFIKLKKTRLCLNL